MILLQEAENIRDTVIPRVLPPTLVDMTTDPDGDYAVSWIEQNPEAASIKFQLDELINLTLLEDDAETTHQIWEYEGFSRSSQRAYSGSYSYKSLYDNEKTSGMVNAYPFVVEEGTLLSFWCWYNIEEDWDYAFVEISTDGRSYDVLEGFTGSSEGWILKQYSLDAFVGDSVFIRFRYTTDANTQEEGFYVDNIYPAAEYSSVITLSEDITSNSFDINGRPEGFYFYRVRGYNDNHEWGDFSSLEDMHVTSGYNQPPTKPDLHGTTNGKAGVEYMYSFQSSDPNDDMISYFIEWGDGSDSGWLGPYNSSEQISLSHSWDEKGQYTIRCKVKDVFGVQSDWGGLEISMPKINFHHLPFINWLLQHFPVLQKILGF
jgi:hypothetical protein